MTASDLQVYIVSRSDPTIKRFINIVKVSNENGDQHLIVKFGGSESGVYDLYVQSLSYGRFDSTGITLTLVGKVTSISPSSGSVHGGTLVTIKGSHFSEDATDNPVRIGYSDCLVESSSDT